MDIMDIMDILGDGRPYAANSCACYTYIIISRFDDL